MSRRVADVIRQASKFVTPTREEESRLERVESMVRKLVKDSFAMGDVVPEAVLGGSYAKGTWLKGEADIDYFLLYPETYPREKLEGEAIDIALKAIRRFKFNLRYAEHPYVEAFVENTRVNLVPAYKVVKGRWRSAVDRSPYHTEYIRERFDARLRLETRLLKKFARSADLYGAEVKTQGLSGYVCEVLALKYGSLESVLQALSVISRGEVISLEPYDRELASSFSSAIVILDPVDTTRNLGTAISNENFGRFILRARSFLSRPSISCFRLRDPSGSKRSNPDPELLKRVVVVTFRNKPRSADVLWGQLRKSRFSIESKLSNLGFKVLRSTVASSEKGESAFIFFLLENLTSEFQVRAGPDVFRKDDLERYISKNRKRYLLSWIDSEGRAVSLFRRDRKLTLATSALEKLLSTSKFVKSMGLSKGIDSDLKRGFSVRDGLSFVRGKDKDWLRKSILSLASGETEFGAKRSSS